MVPDNLTALPSQSTVADKSGLRRHVNTLMSASSVVRQLLQLTTEESRGEAGSFDTVVVGASSTQPGRTEVEEADPNGEASKMSFALGKATGSRAARSFDLDENPRTAAARNSFVKAASILIPGGSSSSREGEGKKPAHKHLGGQLKAPSPTKQNTSFKQSFDTASMATLSTFVDKETLSSLAGHGVATSSFGDAVELPPSEDDDAPLRKQTRSRSQQLAVALTASLTKPLAEAAQQAVREELNALTPKLIARLREEARSIVASVEALGHQLAAAVTQEVAVGRQASSHFDAPDVAPPPSPPAPPPPGPTFFKRTNSTSSMVRRKSSLRSSGAAATAVQKWRESRTRSSSSMLSSASDKERPSDVMRDVRTLQDDVADQVLQGFGFPRISGGGGRASRRVRKRSISNISSNDIGAGHLPAKPAFPEAFSEVFPEAFLEADTSVQPFVASSVPDVEEQPAEVPVALDPPLVGAVETTDVVAPPAEPPTPSSKCPPSWRKPPKPDGRPEGCDPPRALASLGSASSLTLGAKPQVLTTPRDSFQSTMSRMSYNTSSRRSSRGWGARQGLDVATPANGGNECECCENDEARSEPGAEEDFGCTTRSLDRSRRPSVVRSMYSGLRSDSALSKSLRMQMTTEELLSVRVAELTEDIPRNIKEVREIVPSEMSPDDSDFDSDEVASDHRAVPSAPLVLKLCGIVPWSRSERPIFSLWYQRLVACVIIAAALEMVVETINSRRGVWAFRRDCQTQGVCWSQPGLLSDITLSFSATAGLVLLGVLRGSQVLDDTFALLHAYAYQQDMTSRWLRCTAMDARLLLAIFMAGTCAEWTFMMHDWHWAMPPADVILRFCTSTVTRSAIACLTLCVMHVCRALNIMVDIFCCNVVDHPVMSEAVKEWNVLQAVLRKASSSIELCFVGLQAGAAFTVPTLIADLYVLGMSIEALPALVPGTLITIGVMRMFFLAGAITDKCARVPSLVNSLYFGEGTQRVKQHTVEYIVNSAAGFYVCDVRLNTGMALKFLYGWSVVAFGLGTKGLECQASRA